MRAPSVSAARMGRIRQARTQSHTCTGLQKHVCQNQMLSRQRQNQQGESLARTACTFPAPRAIWEKVAPSPLPGRARTFGMSIGPAAVRQR